MARNSKKWSAIEDTGFAGHNRKLAVTGEVATHSGAERAVLVRAEPQGFNPSILILDLSIESDGVGTAVEGWTKAVYEEAVSHGEFKQVQIRGEVEVLIDVEVVIA